MSTNASQYEGVEQLQALAAARLYNAHLQQRVLEFAERSRRDTGWNALDFGAGLGSFAKEVRSAGADVQCVEPDEKMRESLEASGFRAHHDLEGVAEKSLDFVYSLNVLEHIDEDTATLRAIAHRLRRGGGLYLYVPAFPVLYSANDRAVGHLRRYRRSELQRKVENAGFSIESARYVDPLGFLAALAYRFSPGSDGSLSYRSVRLYDSVLFPLSLRLQPLAQRWLGKNVEVRARAL